MDGLQNMDAEGEVEVEFKPPDFTGKAIIQYLQDMKSGATMGEILQYLQTKFGKDPEELTSTVVSILENGTALGFLERKGSHDLNWAAREACCKKRRRRRRRSSCCRCKRRIRRCSCSRRKRRRRC